MQISVWKWSTCSSCWYCVAVTPCYASGVLLLKNWTATSLENFVTSFMWRILNITSISTFSMLQFYGFQSLLELESVSIVVTA